ncbi:MAG: protein translocase subunit SecF [Propionibacteriaceae bacterium]|jgi:preprotein translocase subunit SecF|nr:protein translocase subunit SecF [Propionibacteriaceae bacterium]
MATPASEQTVTTTETTLEEKASPAPRPADSSSKGRNFAHRLWTGEVSYDFVGHRRTWYIVSAVILLISIGALLIRGLDLGIEFRGGSDFRVPVATMTDDTVSQFRDAVMDSGVDDLNATTVTTIGDDQVQIETRALNVDEVATIRGAIAEVAGVDSEHVAYQQIGASWGRQVTEQAAIALIVFLIAVSAMIWIYFRDFKMAVAAIAALLHDLIVTVGVYALLGFTVTPAGLTGVLTILGYSLYDTVVVFDKVRENTAELDEYKVTYSEAANRAVNQVLIRSINTTVIGVLPVAAILFAGAFLLGFGPLEDIGLALFVGMIAGAYSSIFIATPLLAQLKMAEPAMKEQAAKVERRLEKIARQKEKATVSAPVVSVVEADDATAALPATDLAAASLARRKPTRAERKNTR